MQGKIIRGIAGFYYVNIEQKGIIECKAKGIFRNRKEKPLVGDVFRVCTRRICGCQSGQMAF